MYFRDFLALLFHYYSIYSIYDRDAGEPMTNDKGFHAGHFPYCSPMMLGRDSPKRTSFSKRGTQSDSTSSFALFFSFLSFFNSRYSGSFGEHRSMFVLTLDPTFSHLLVSLLPPVSSPRLVSPSSLLLSLGPTDRPTTASGRCMRLKDPIPYCTLLRATVANPE